MQLASERQRLICQKAQRDGQVLINELALEFDVSDQTIRRDINYLNEINVIRKVHGGAVPILKNQLEGAYVERLAVDREEKDKIGMYGAALIEDNDVIALDSGATIDSFAYAINGVHNIKIILNSISALNILMTKKRNGDFTGEIIFLGGRVDCDSRYVLDPLTFEMLRRFRVDKAFIACTAVSSSGIRMFDLQEGVYTNTLIQQSATVILLSASSKLEKEAMYKICNLKNIQHLITDDSNKISPVFEKNLETAGVCLHVVEVKG